MTAQPTPTSPTALHLLSTAERLFAEHGVDGVSLRRIVSEAGSSNSSVVQNHFGSKEAQRWLV